MAASASDINLGAQLFRWRDYTPIPLIILLLIFQRPGPGSAILGLLMVLVGEAIRMYSVAYIGSISRTRKSSTGNHLISEGPFSLVRNPLYLGNFIIVLGIVVFARHWGLGLLSLGLCYFQYHYIVCYEESLLKEKFGEEFEDYLRRVPKWLPKELPSLKDLPWPESFAGALKSEKRTLSAIAAVFVLMILFA